MLAESTEYTLGQVAENSGKDGKRTWIIIKDSVYDVTDYLDEHPGGGDLILEQAGKDATKAFNEFGHSRDAKNIMKKYKIGEIVQDERSKQNKTKSKNPEPEIKTVQDDANINKSNRSCISIITCGCLT